MCTCRYRMARAVVSSPWLFLQRGLVSLPGFIYEDHNAPEEGFFIDQPVFHEMQQGYWWHRTCGGNTAGGLDILIIQTVDKPKTCFLADDLPGFLQLCMDCIHLKRNAGPVGNMNYHK